MNKTPLEGLLSVVRDLDVSNCWNSFYQEHVDTISNISLDHYSNVFGTRQMLYQKCTQFGHFLTSDSPAQPFGNLYPLSFFTDLCTNVFGDWMNAAITATGVDRLNVEHGGLRPQVSNTLFTFAEVDFYKSLNVREDLGESSLAFEIKGPAFSNEFYRPSEYFDSDEMLQTKRDIVKLVQSWI